METIEVKQLRNNLSKILLRVESGQIIRVLRHGKDIVELRPIKKYHDLELVAHLEKRGLLAGGSGKIRPVKSVKNRNPKKPISDIISEHRR